MIQEALQAPHLKRRRGMQKDFLNYLAYQDLCHLQGMTFQRETDHVRLSTLDRQKISSKKSHIGNECLKFNF